MKRKPDVIHQDVLFIRKQLERFTLPVLAQMHRIDRYEATDVSGSGELKPKNTISDPVGNKVVSILSGRNQADPVGKAAKDIERELHEMRRRVEILVQQLDFVLNPRDRHKDNVIIHCAACEREVAGTTNDRIRSGYCQACYREWLRQGKPNRGHFEATRRPEPA